MKDVNSWDIRENWYSLLISILTHNNPSDSIFLMTGEYKEKIREEDLHPKTEHVRVLYEAGVSMVAISKITGCTIHLVRKILGRTAPRKSERVVMNEQRL